MSWVENYYVEQKMKKTIQNKHNVVAEAATQQGQVYPKGTENLTFENESLWFIVEEQE